MNDREPIAVPSKLAEQILAHLEESCMPEKYTDAVLAMVEEFVREERPALFFDLHMRVALLMPHNYIDVDLSGTTWWIEHRPGYCDRGRYQWHCESKDSRIITVDFADGFPRYFFGLDAMLSEMQAWCEKRGQELVWVSEVKGPA